MNRRVLVIVLVVALLVGAVALLVMLFQPPAPRQEAVSARSAPVRAPRARATPTPAPPEEAASPSEPRGAEAPVVVEETPAARAMEAPPVLGVLRIESDVPGAQVFIDRRFIGAAPATAEDVTPGTHQLNVSAEGFDSVAMPIDVAPGQRQIVVKLREVRLDSAIDVVHRHGVGSCRGRLIATPTGLRYETSNRDDAFTTASLDLEIFQVDYLAKNLRVKLPKGRQFNFTDPDGNADRLFVFHRDVENARERLRKGNRPATN